MTFLRVSYQGWEPPHPSTAPQEAAELILPPLHWYRHQGPGWVAARNTTEHLLPLTARFPAQLGQAASRRGGGADHVLQPFDKNSHGPRPETEQWAGAGKAGG